MPEITEVLAMRLVIGLTVSMVAWTLVFRMVEYRWLTLVKVVACMTLADIGWFIMRPALAVLGIVR